MCECEKFLDAISKSFIDEGVYKDDAYYINREVWSICGYEDTEYIKIEYCPFCGEKL